MLTRNYPRSLRFRLTLWNSLVVFLASVAALFAVREAMRLTIEDELKGLLREESVELKLAVQELHPNQNLINEEFARKVLSHSQQDWFAGLLDDRDQFIWKSENFPTNWNDDQASDSVVGSGFAFRQTHDWILVGHQAILPGGEIRKIVLGEPVEFIRQDVWKLTKVMLLIGIALGIVAPIGGYLLARNATRPVRQIIETTRSLQPENLDNRLEIRGTGDELDQISVEINSFVDQISRYINGQKDFVANAAHELRSPIAAIQTSVEVTLGKNRSLNEYRSELETVSEQCQELRHLVNQLLELAETETSLRNPVFERFDFTHLVKKSVSVFMGVAEEKKIEIVDQIESGIAIEGDRTKVRQLVNNLLDNALKYNRRGGTVWVSLSMKSDGVSFVVRDTGPGVSETQLKRIFERFYRVDQARQRDGLRGNGLGLSICQSVMELHKGWIRAENDRDGLVVSAWFPANRDS